MTIFRAQIAFPMDSALPRDEFQINPHFNGLDPAALAVALKANLIAAPAITTKPFKIKIYDAKKAPPSYPLATAEQTGTAPANSQMREACLCLSYYAQWNRPRYRGRLYIPAIFAGGSLAVKPTTTQMNNVLALKIPFSTGLPASTFWTVWSAAAGLDAQVTNVWVDDEWDVMRSRGLRATARSTGTVP